MVRRQVLIDDGEFWMVNGGRGLEVGGSILVIKVLRYN